MPGSLPLEFLRSLRLTLIFFVMLGLLYPLLITGVARLIFPGQAGGNLITRNGQVVGSRLIGQQFTDSRYFHGRPSATVNEVDPTRPEPYNAQNSAGSNLAPSNQALSDRVAAEAARVRQENYQPPGSPVPVDLVTASFSGLDPDISEAAALYQVTRVARVRGLDRGRVTRLVERHVRGRFLGLFGEPRVNVLELNLALDGGAAG